MPTAVKGAQLSRDPAVGEAYLTDPLNFHKATTRLGANIFASQDRVGPLLSQISIPTFVIHGGDDTVVPPEASQLLLGLPGVERRLYPSLRHECLNEPEGREVMGDIISWLDEHSVRREPSR
jgi:alpha-beta hydrolase superfamily lysophospholipase